VTRGWQLELTAPPTYNSIVSTVLSQTQFSRNFACKNLLNNSVFIENAGQGWMAQTLKNLSVQAGPPFRPNLPDFSGYFLGFLAGFSGFFSIFPAFLPEIIQELSSNKYIDCQMTLGHHSLTIWAFSQSFQGYL
jgi:hypothetical protein